MIPENIDIPDLRAQIEADSVAIAQLGEEYPTLEPELIDVMQHGVDSGFGNAAFVFLDETPDGAGVPRDVAQELLMTTDFDTVIVRAPATGAIVSEEYSRAAIEAAQYEFLANPELAVATRDLMDTLNQHTFPWAIINIVIALLVTVAVVVSVYYVRTHRPITSSVTA